MRKFRMPRIIWLLLVLQGCGMLRGDCDTVLGCLGFAKKDKK